MVEKLPVSLPVKSSNTPWTLPGKESVPIPRGSRIRDNAIIIPDRTPASSKDLEVISKGSIKLLEDKLLEELFESEILVSSESLSSKKPEPIKMGGIKTRKKDVPMINIGLNILTTRIKIPQKKLDKKSKIINLPLNGIKRRLNVKVRVVSPYTHKRANVHKRAKEKRLEAKIINPAPLKHDNGEYEPQIRCELKRLFMIYPVLFAANLFVANLFALYRY